VKDVPYVGAIRVEPVGVSVTGYVQYETRIALKIKIDMSLYCRFYCLLTLFAQS